MTDVEFSRLNEKERKENLEMMKSPTKWRLYPFLPMKKVVGPGLPEFAFLLAAMGKPKLYLHNYYGLDETGVRTIKDIEKKIESKEYDSFESILNDGWEVD